MQVGFIPDALSGLEDSTRPTKQGEIAWRFSADEQNNACHKDDEGNVTNRELSKYKLEYSHRACEYEQQQIVMSGMVEGIAHPSLDGRTGGSIRL